MGTLADVYALGIIGHLEQFLLQISTTIPPQTEGNISSFLPTFHPPLAFAKPWVESNILYCNNPGLY